jgi:ABC-type multidrug transport system fused ATPase/permease subunit
VLAVVVPVAVLVAVAAIDPLAAGVMLLTLPLVPVFMWLVGRYTERRARERWQALALLSNHFLDVVRGLPTLRAFNRGRVQEERIVEVSDDYRTATMGTLRVAFLSGSVLALAATLGIVMVGVPALRAWLGPRGIWAGAFLAGFADTHAAAISVASLAAAGRLGADEAVLPILLGFSSNSVMKIVAARMSGGRPFAARLAPGIVLIALAAWAGLALA